jgi:hypothetical protein
VSPFHEAAASAISGGFSVIYRNNASFVRSSFLSGWLLPVASRALFSGALALGVVSVGIIGCGGEEKDGEVSQAEKDCLAMNMGNPNAEALCIMPDNTEGFLAEGEEGAGGGPGTGVTAPGGFAACATGNASADLSPVSMLIVFDRSSSMRDNNKWADATAALISFLENPQSGGLGVGLRFYPDDEPTAGCNQEACNFDACAVPLIESGILAAAAGDPQELALVGAIEARDAWEDSLGTPTHPALGGGLDWARNFQNTHAGERGVVVLVTDGEPNGCDETIESIAGLAAAAYDDDNVQTYAIGLEGSNEGQMNQIAEAGGTGDGFFIGAGENAEADLLEALNAIRGNTLACDFEVPNPDTGTLDPTKVNLEVATPDGAVSFLNVPSEEDCGDTTSWFFSEGNQRIELCEAACDVVLSDPSNHVNLFFGCETESLPGTGAR